MRSILAWDRVKVCLGPTLATTFLFALCQPPFGLAFLPFAALVPWLVFLRKATLPQARTSGVIYGVGYVLTQMWFVAPLLNNYTGSWLVPILPMLILCIIGGVLFMGLSTVLHRCWEKNWWWLIPPVWAGFEALRSYMGDLSFPWGILAHPLWSFPMLAQAAAGGTVFFVSAWCVTVNLLILFAVFPSEDKSKQISGNALFRGAMLCCLVMIASVYRWGTLPRGVVRPVTAAQPGVNLAYLRGDERQVQVELSGNEMARQVALQGKTDLVVLPEGYAPGGQIPPINPFGPTPPFPVVFGGTFRTGEKSYQGAFAYDPKRAEWQASGKERLVVLGEFLPFSDVLPVDSWINLGFRSFDKGQHKLFEVSGMKVGTAICYEGLFSDTTAKFQSQGANLIAVISIDDWYVNTPAWDMLWQSTVWRAIESGLPVVRSGGLGRSLVADSRGRVLSLVEPNKRIATRVEVLVPDEGDGFAYRMVFVWLCLASVAFVVGEWVVAIRRGRKNEPSVAG